MKRWHEEYPRTYREWRKHYLAHVEDNVEFTRVPDCDPYLIDCDCDQQKGRFRKRRALGCGRGRCQFCHSYKFPKRLTTLAEQGAELKFKEGIKWIASGDGSTSKCGV